MEWTRGARHFLDHLVDGDVASNQHGWQWDAPGGTPSGYPERIVDHAAERKESLARYAEVR